MHISFISTSYAQNYSEDHFFNLLNALFRIVNKQAIFI